MDLNRGLVVVLLLAGCGQEVATTEKVEPKVTVSDAECESWRIKRIAELKNQINRKPDAPKSLPTLDYYDEQYRLKIGTKLQAEVDILEGRKPDTSKEDAEKLASLLAEECSIRLGVKPRYSVSN